MNKPCVYCGDPASDRDHLTPCSWQGTRSYEAQTVPSCNDCNITLGSVPLFTLEDRRWHVIQRLRKRVVKYTGQSKHKRAADVARRAEAALEIQRDTGYHTSPPIYKETIGE